MLLWRVSICVTLLYTDAFGLDPLHQPASIAETGDVIDKDLYEELRVLYPLDLYTEHREERDDAQRGRGW